MDSPNLEPRTERSRVPWSGLDALGVFLLTLLLIFVVGLLVARGAEAGLIPERFGRMILLPLSQVLLGGIALGYVALRYRGAARLLLGRSWPGVGAIGVGVGLGVAAFLLQVLVGLLVERFLDVPLEEVQSGLKEALRDPGLRPYVAVAAVVLAPLSEELFFRGMLYQALRDRRGTGSGMFLSSAIFALLHLNPAAPMVVQLLIFLLMLGIGFLLAWVFERRGTLLAPIALHATFNLLGVLAILAVPEVG